MRNLLNAEWLRLMRRGMLGAAAALVGLGVLATVLIFGQASDSPEGETPGLVRTALLEGADGLVQSLTLSSQVVGAASLVLFARTVTNDYQQGTLKVLLTREPRRLALLSAKFLAMALFVVLAVLAMFVAMTGAASLVAAARGIDASAWWTAAGIGETLLGLLRLLAASLVWGLLGFALGTLFRSAGPAIGVGIGMLAIGGHLVERFWSNAGSWYPSSVLSVFTVGGTDAVSLAWAGLVVALYAVGFAAAAAGGFLRGDVPG